jgi:hypothetical protein
VLDTKGHYRRYILGKIKKTWTDGLSSVKVGKQGKDRVNKFFLPSVFLLEDDKVFVMCISYAFGKKKKVD